MTPLSVGRAWSGRSIQARVVLLVSTGILAALAILGGTAWVGLDRMAGRLSAERLLLARSIAEHLDYMVQADLEVLQNVSAAPRLDLGDGDPLPEQSALREAYLRGRLVERVFLIAADRSPVLCEPESRSTEAPAPDGRDVESAFRSGRPTVSNLTGSGLARRVHLLVPMRNWRGEVVAISAGEIDPAGSRLSAALAPFQFTRTGSIDVLDGTGRTIASTDRSRRLRADDNAI